MPSRIIYLPIEPYKSRYTQYTSVKDGVYETCFKEMGIDFLAIRPDSDLRVVQQGQVLDVQERTDWGFRQISQLVKIICGGTLDPNEDVIYLEDFWTPGFEMIPYAQSSKFGPNPMEHIPVYSFCHAQSWDKHDFTATWKWWIRPLELMWLDYNTKVFCAAKEMLPMIQEAGGSLVRGQQFKVVPVGHAFHKETMFRTANLIDLLPTNRRQKQVIYSSRFDAEKNPQFFMDLIESVLKDRKDISFILCTGQPIFSSNNPEHINRLLSIKQHEGYDNVFIETNLDLHRYYGWLRRAKVQFNCALQDFVSYTLLDAAINGCAPLYPHWLTFPDALNHNPKHLYRNMDLQDAKAKLYALIDEPIDNDFSWIYSKYEKSVRRMVQHMGLTPLD